MCELCSIHVGLCIPASHLTFDDRFCNLHAWTKTDFRSCIQKIVSSVCVYIYSITACLFGN